MVINKQKKADYMYSFCNGKRHDFRLYKEYKVRIHPLIKAVTDSGYQGLKKLHANTEMSQKGKESNL